MPPRHHARLLTNCPLAHLPASALPCPALPCPALPCPALPCPALPCPALPCPALPCTRPTAWWCRHLPTAGVLACLDGYMNIAMEQTEEYVNGQLKHKYGDCFIRGNNGAGRSFSCRGQRRYACCLHGAVGTSARPCMQLAPSDVTSPPAAAPLLPCWLQCSTSAL